ncbi:hypothetical protein HMPREF9436_00462 [Faecalibacterium cf. prausnitzii KLE1255]|uniref:Uncharacterized protein n=1 Tax=Faecalibacterium cf. prausnitzii KLE1255 TaxID=748224 RepID=E2ZFM9_9FIRM|nr:hypothetical protein HMPREF9436_00462 [Faecalibacterium cf. prausnitzii KLE1255]
MLCRTLKKPNSRFQHPSCIQGNILFGLCQGIFFCIFAVFLIFREIFS